MAVPAWLLKFLFAQGVPYLVRKFVNRDRSARLPRGETMIGEFFGKLMKGKGTYSLIGIGIVAMVLNAFGVDIVSMVAKSPEGQAAIKTIYGLLGAATLRRAMPK
jgi:hypothetical protein